MSARAFTYPNRLELARTPTPLQPLPRLSRELGVELWCKRDDLTDTPMSGNKLRKLEFLLAAARESGCDAVLTTGGVQSNHARATAIAAVRLGLAPYLLLRGSADTPVQGNLLLDRVVGAQVRFITKEQYADRNALMAQWAQALRASEGRRVYVIPEGGSDEVGAWGYVHALDELLSQAREAGVTFDSVVHASGSGGTLAGLALGRALLGYPGRIVAFAVCDDAAYFRAVASRITSRAIERYGLSVAVPANTLEVDDGFVGRGYGLTRPEELDHLVHVARQEGLFLDPVYTNKAFLGLATRLREAPRAYGERVLFVHTGGLFGLFAQADDVAAASERQAS